jgi:hypothetical protein
LNVSSLNDAAPTPTFQNLNMQPSKIDPFRKMTATSLDRKKLRLPRVPILNCPKNIEPVNWEDGYRLAELNFQMSTMPRSFTPNPRNKTLSELQRDIAISRGRKNMDPQTRSFSDRKNSEIWIDYTQTSHQ